MNKKKISLAFTKIEKATQTCYYCKSEKPVTEFAIKRNKRDTRCKQCKREIRNTRYKQKQKMLKRHRKNRIQYVTEKPYETNKESYLSDRAIMKSLLTDLCVSVFTKYYSVEDIVKDRRITLKPGAMS